MARRVPFTIVYDTEVKDHLRTIDRKHHSLIRESIEDQLTYEPDVETRNRKPLLPHAENDWEWELRLGPDNCFRVFYAIEHESHEVQILAIGVKRGNRLWVAGEEIKL